MSELNDEIRASLSEAGIGKRFHDMSIVDVPHGPAMLGYLRTHGRGFKTGHSVAFQGIGLTDAITMLARALHINGTGCKVLPLVRLRGIINNPELREAIDDADVLVVMNAQDTNRGNPLHDAVSAEVEYLLRKRIDNKQSIILQFAVPEDAQVSALPNCYWSDELLSALDTTRRFEHVTLTKLKSYEVNEAS